MTFAVMRGSEASDIGKFVSCCLQYFVIVTCRKIILRNLTIMMIRLFVYNVLVIRERLFIIVAK